MEAPLCASPEASGSRCLGASSRSEGWRGLPARLLRSTPLRHWTDAGGGQHSSIPRAPLSLLNLRADSPQVPRAGSRPEGRDCAAELAIPLLRWLLLVVLFLAELIGFRFRFRRAALGDNARWWAEFKVARQTLYISSRCLPLHLADVAVTRLPARSFQMTRPITREHLREARLPVGLIYVEGGSPPATRRYQEGQARARVSAGSHRAANDA
jgi:hypothetical protein